MKCTSCSQQVKPIFVGDIDGTLGDYHAHFFSFVELWRGESSFGGNGLTQSAIWKRNYDGSTDLATFLGLTKVEYRKIKLAYRQGGMKRCMPQVPYAHRTMHSIKDLGYEIWIATTRPYNRLDNVDPDTQFWLANNDLPYDHLLYGEDKYEELVRQVDQERIVLVLEDLPEQFDRGKLLGLPMVQKGSRYNTSNTARRSPRVRDLEEVLPTLRRKAEQWAT